MVELSPSIVLVAVLAFGVFFTAFVIWIFLGGSTFSSVLMIKSSAIGAGSEKEMKGSPKKRMRCPNTDSSKAARMILKEYILGG